MTSTSQKLLPVSSVMQKPRIALLVRLISEQTIKARGRAGAVTHGPVSGALPGIPASAVPAPPAYRDMDPNEFEITLSDSDM